MASILYVAVNFQAVHSISQSTIFSVPSQIQVLISNKRREATEAASRLTFLLREHHLSIPLLFNREYMQNMAQQLHLIRVMEKVVE